MGRKVTAADIQVEIAKGAFRPHTALSNMALSYFQSDKNYFAIHFSSFWLTLILLSGCSTSPILGIEYCAFTITCPLVK